MSDLTVEATECFNDAVIASCDSVDATIKNTYAMLAKVGINNCFHHFLFFELLGKNNARQFQIGLLQPVSLGLELYIFLQKWIWKL